MLGDLNDFISATGSALGDFSQQDIHTRIAQLTHMSRRIGLQLADYKKLCLLPEANVALLAQASCVYCETRRELGRLQCRNCGARVWR